jgi:hypothetical protein
MTQHEETARVACELSRQYQDKPVQVYRWADRTEGGYSDRHFIRWDARPKTEVEGRPIVHLATYKNGDKLSPADNERNP